MGTTTCAVALGAAHERAFVLDLALATGDAAEVAAAHVAVPDAFLRIACGPVASPAELAAGLASGAACRVLPAPALPEQADLDRRARNCAHPRPRSCERPARDRRLWRASRRRDHSRARASESRRDRREHRCPRGPRRAPGFAVAFAARSLCASRRRRRDRIAQPACRTGAGTADRADAVRDGQAGLSCCARTRAGTAAAGGSIRRARRSHRRARRVSLWERAQLSAAAAFEGAPTAESVATRPDPLAILLNDPSITEVIANGPAEVWVERRGRLQRAALRFDDASALRDACVRLAARAGRRLDDAQPMVDARLADGSRLNVVLPPLAPDGPLLTLRRFTPRPFTLTELVDLGSLTEADADLLDRLCPRAAVDRDQRRHVDGQDVAAGRTRRVHRRERADRDGRGRRRAAHRSPARGAPGGRAERVSRARARSASGNSCATRCECGPTDWSWARCAAARRSTCSRR